MRMRLAIGEGPSPHATMKKQKRVGQGHGQMANMRKPNQRQREARRRARCHGETLTCLQRDGVASSSHDALPQVPQATVSLRTRTHHLKRLDAKSLLEACPPERRSTCNNLSPSTGISHLMKIRGRKTIPEEQKQLREHEKSLEDVKKEAVEEEEDSLVLSVKEEDDSPVKVEEEEAEEEEDKPLCIVMAIFLRYDAYRECLLDEEDWISVDDSVLHRLRATWEEVVEVVRTSDTRFELTISGPHSWLRATRGPFYRQRSLERAGMS